MKKMLSVIMALGVIFTSFIAIPTKNTTANGTFIDSIDSEMYLAYVENLNNNWISSPELIDVLYDIIKPESSMNISHLDIKNLWLSPECTAKSSKFIFEYSRTDGFDIYIKQNEFDIESILNDFRSQLGFSNKITVNAEETFDKLYIRINGLFLNDDHELNRMISEKAYVLLNEKYEIESCNIGINKRQFQEVVMYNNVYQSENGKPKIIAPDLVDTNMLKEKYNAEYNEKGLVILPSDSSTKDFWECLQYFTKNFDASVFKEFHASNQIYASQIDFEKIDYVKGDANLDAQKTVADAVAILQFIGNRDKYQLSAQGAFNADVDDEEGVTANDALTIQQWDSQGKI